MKRLLLLSCIIFVEITLSAAPNLDSLFNVYQTCSNLQKQTIANKLVDYFVQEEYYNYPVNLKKKSKRDYRDMLIYLGMAAENLDRGEFEEAQKCAERALSLVEKDSLVWKIDCHEVLSIIYFRQGKYDLSMSYAEENFEIASKLKDNRALSSALNTMAAVNLANSRFEEALDYINKALEIERKENNDKALAIRLGMKSDILLGLHRPEDALKCVNEALKIDAAANRLDKVGVRLSQKADILMRLGKWEECRDICLEANDIFEKTNNIVSKVITLKQLGSCELQLNHLDKAEKYLLEAEEICKKIGFKSLLWNVQHHLFSVYKKQNKLEKSLYYLECSMINRDSIMQEEHQRQLSEYKVKFDVQEKENQLAIQKLTNRNKTIVIVVLGIVLFFIVTLALMLMYNSAIRKKRSEELMRLNAAKDKIFSIVSHDLKNPIAAQNKVLHLLDDSFNEIDAKDVKMQVTELRKSSDSLSSFLRSLLDWAMFNSGRMQYNPVQADLTDMVKSVVNEVHIQANNKSVEIHNNCLEDAYIFVDINMMETVIRNLLSNAIKFSHPNSTVEIDSIDNGDCWSLSITDQGVGIPLEIQSGLFKNNTTTTRGTAGEKGTGLGLNMCGELVKLNHGTISVLSEPDQGSKFTINMPKSIPNSKS